MGSRTSPPLYMTVSQSHPYQSHSQDPTLSGRDAEAWINRACTVLRSIYGLTPDNHPDPRLCSAPPPKLTHQVQSLYFPEPLQIRRPTVSWYIANLSYYARASAGVFHTAIAYLERAQPRFNPVPADPRTAFVAALILAHRFLEDGSYKTDTWARLSGSSARMISACVEAMFDALEHRLWIGPLPTPAQNRMFSMREGTIFCEEMNGSQRRCSLPSLSVLYGPDRAFGDPQSVPVEMEDVAAPAAGPSTLPAVKAVQGLPSPPDSPSSPLGTPPALHTAGSVHRATCVPNPVPEIPSAPRQPACTGEFSYSDWQAGAGVSMPPPPPAPYPSTQHPHPHTDRLPPPPIYNPPAPTPRIVQPDESPVFDAVLWGATQLPTEPPSTNDASEANMDMDISPPGTPLDSDAFNPLLWASQGALMTPAPTTKISEKSGLRYPQAILVPPAILDPVFEGRRHSR